MLADETYAEDALSTTEIGRSLGTDYFGLRDELTDAERDYLRRTRAFVDNDVLPVINGYWERARSSRGRSSRRWHPRHRRGRHRGLRLPGDEPGRRGLDQHGAQPRRRQPRYLSSSTGRTGYAVDLDAWLRAAEGPRWPGSTSSERSL
jgi:hypothetical protein